ncbi:glucokinase [Edaphobacter modestus]|uniref:Glucokinase n=2 Tax=Edaphobacter modestus TaxID=388466 RepID=A0A4Q7YXH6_9BACT|nr:glucokinase [Edaphobacter modestus]
MRLNVGNYVIGIDIGGTNLRLAVADDRGSILARWSSLTTGHRGAEAIVDLICSGINHVLEQAGLPKSALKAVGAGVPGVTNVDAGLVIATSYLLGWRDVPLRELLEARLGVPAVVDNDVNVAAFGEGRMGAARDTRDFVFLAIGTGIGAGIILDGKLFRGMNWSAGEVGYMLVPGVSEEPVERGKPGPIESLIGGEGIREQWQLEWEEGKTSLPREASATQIFDGAGKGDTLAQKMLDRCARILGYTIYNLSVVFNCPLVVLGGSVAMHEGLCVATRQFMERWGGRFEVEIRRSELGTDAQLAGAICLALDSAK